MLTKALRYNYGKTDNKILSILRKKRNGVTTTELTERLYEGMEMPFHAKIRINTSMRNLIKNVNANNEDFKIECTRVGEYHYRYVA